MLKKLYHQFLENKYIVLLILLGTISWSLTMVKSGWNYSYGVGFWGANGHDAIWHIALSKSLSRNSFEIPVFAGETLKNYHIGFDLVLVAFNRLTRISFENLYFRVFPIIFSLLIGMDVYNIVRIWKGKKEAFWSTFFVYFGGSFGWLVTLLRDKTLGGESMFWSQQAISTLINPPFALSVLIILSAIIFLVMLVSGLKTNVKMGIINKKIFLYFISIFLIGILIEIKVYAGLLFLPALFTSAVFDYIKNKRTELIKVFVFSLLLTGIIFLPNLTSSKLIIFKPFWFLQTLVGLQDRFYWPKMESAIFNYIDAKNYLKLSFAYLVVFALFIIGNLGTRILAVFEVIKTPLKKLNYLDVFVYTIIIEGIVVPMFFLQTGTPWNTIQFFYYSLFFASILTGIAVAKLNKYLLVIVVLFTIPTTLGTLMNDYLPSRPPAMISKEELKALQFLNNQDNGVVLTYVFDDYKAKEAISNPPRPLYLYDSTAYVSAYSNKPVYLEDQVNLDITGYDWRARREKEDWFIETTDAKAAKEFLKENKIKYLYLVKKLSPLSGEYLKLGPKQIGAEPVFENNEVVIWKLL